jgi:hypothetical protein
MNNLYHKLTIASVCTALSFTFGANKEAKAATFILAPTITFEVIDGGSYNGQIYDGLGDVVFPGNFDIVAKFPPLEAAQFAEINIGSFFFAPNTITSAIFQAQIYNIYKVGHELGFFNPRSVGIFGYIGNGTVEASDFEAGVFLSSVDVSSSSPGDILNFDVSSFVNQRVSKGDAFAGFGIRVLNNGIFTMGGTNFAGIPPRLIVETADIAEPVPEPTTIFGSALALSLGGWLKRKKLSPQNKTASQG